MTGSLTDAASRERLLAELRALPGVRRAFLDDEEKVLHLVCPSDEARPSLEGSVRAAIARCGIDPDSLGLEVSFLARAGVERRARFEEVRLDRPRVGTARATAVLEWRGRSFEGTAEGESSPAGDLRVCAEAAIRALEQVVGGELHFDLLGLKAVRVFDQDMVAAILRCAEIPERRLVGIALTLVDPYRAASLAVLNATNRLMGNYLVVPE